jgi:hypothetical protein
VLSTGTMVKVVEVEAIREHIDTGLDSYLLLKKLSDWPKSFARNTIHPYFLG